MTVTDLATGWVFSMYIGSIKPNAFDPSDNWKGVIKVQVIKEGFNNILKGI